MIELSDGALARLVEIRGFALDLDGTTYLGDRLLPGAIEFKKKAEALGIKVVYLTNNSSRSRKEYVERLRSLGIPVTDDQVLTSGEATIGYILGRHKGKKVLLLGTASLELEFLEAGIPLARHIHEAEVAVMGFDTTLTYKKLRDFCDCVRTGIPFIATHPDKVCPVPGGAIPDVGSFLALVETATGRRPDEVIGKPSLRMVEALSQKMNLSPREIAFIGDRLYTDVVMARNSGMLSILVLSGETKLQDIEGSSVKPDLVLKDLSEAVTLLDRTS